jgi:hypothetical protein
MATPYLSAAAVFFLAVRGTHRKGASGAYLATLSQHRSGRQETIALATASAGRPAEVAATTNRTSKCGGDPAISVRKAAHSLRNRRLSPACGGETSTGHPSASSGLAARQIEQRAMRSFCVRIHAGVRFRARHPNHEPVGGLPVRPFTTGANELHVLSSLRPCQPVSRSIN